MPSVAVCQRLSEPGQLLKAAETEQTRRAEVKIGRNPLRPAFQQSGLSSFELSFLQLVESLECFAKAFAFEIAYEICVFTATPKAGQIAAKSEPALVIDVVTRARQRRTWRSH